MSTQPVLIANTNYADNDSTDNSDDDEVQKKQDEFEAVSCFRLF